MIRVLHMLPDLELGGGQLLLLRNLSAMDRAEFSHVVCTVWPRGNMHEQYRAAGIEVETLGLRSPAGMPAALLRLRRLIRDRRIDLIHTNNTGSDRMFGQAAALLCRKPLVNTLHSALFLGGRQRGAKEVVRRTRLAVDRAIARRTIRHVVAVGESVRLAWYDYVSTLGVSDDRISIVRPGIDMARFPERTDGERTELRASLGLTDASPLLITVARLATGKGHLMLMPLLREVLAAHPGARLLLVGDGPLRDELAALAEREGVAHAVVFAGRRDDVPALLDAADLLVFPSLSEGFPLSILEAMAASLPIAAFDLPSFAELGEARAAASFSPVGDGAALTRAVLDLLANPERMAGMAATGRRIVQERFTQEQTSRALERIYRSVLSIPEPHPTAVPASAAVPADPQHVP